MATRKTEIEVRVGVMGKPIVPVLLPVGATVEDALIAADVDTDVTVKITGREKSLDDVVKDGQRLTIADKVKGGC